MLRIEINNLKKIYGIKTILDIKNLKIYEEDRIGIVGDNGSGKTTFLKLIEGEIKEDRGNIIVRGSKEYVSQLDRPKERFIGGEMASKFDVDIEWSESFSGGENTRYKLASAMENKDAILLIDEPTNNLDMDGIELIRERLKEHRSTLLLVSHDRNLLDNICNKILEINEGKATIYNGNYSDYLVQKEEELSRKEAEYEEYIKEKTKLEMANTNMKNQSSTTRGTPKRMGNSEARLHKMGNQRAKQHLDNKSKSIESRLERLDVKDKPREERELNLEIHEASKIYNKILVSGSKIDKAYGERIIFKDTDFQIYNGKKIGFIGPNGSGKTTLIEMIVNKDDNIELAAGLKIGYFNQSMNILDEEKTILENVMLKTVYTEEFCRLLLARLLFRGDKVSKKVEMLSGGERVRVTLAKVLLEDTNLLIMDEPTNHLDIESLEVLEEALKLYEGSLLLVSHDRSFINNVVDEILYIEDKKLKRFMGNYENWKDRNINKQNDGLDETIMILENRMNSILGQISMADEGQDTSILDKKYLEIAKEINILKKG